MKEWNLRAWISVVLTCAMSWTLMAADSPIGLAVSSGNFLLNRANVVGSATLFEGSTVQTAQSASRLDLKGAWLQLAGDSQVTVSDKLLVLQRGTAELGGQPGYSIEARSLRIAVADPKAVARVRLEGSNKVLVSAANGLAHVYNRSGLLVMDVIPGHAFAFAPQAGAADAADINGCLLFKAGKFIVVDQNGQVSEVAGGNLAQNSGNPVHVIGRIITAPTTVPGATRLIQVQAVEQTGEGGCLAAAQQANASIKPPGAPASAGGQAGQAAKNSHTAIYAGVAAAAAGAVIVGVVAGKGKGSTSPQ
ncbi:MAG TPA: hypothetical protein VG096_18935 [Bryobacteraceae bacterium]|nr:hypothetical protein [Bryobacteraceae bacterium]